MRKFILSLMMISAMLAPAAAFAETAQSIIDGAIDVIKAMSEQDDADSMADVLRDARAVAIVPSMVKAGLIVGGQYGEGLILKRENGKWYGPSFYNIGGGSFGLQLGAQSVSLVLVVTNEKGVNAFLSSKTKLGGDVAIAAGPDGRRAEAATDAQAKASIYSYSMTKGLFAGISLEGSVISISVKRNKQYWGSEGTADKAIGTMASDKRIKPLIDVLENLRKK